MASYYYCYNYFIPSRTLYTSVSRWFFTGAWVTASHHKSLGRFSRFRLILIMLLSRLSPLVSLFPILPAPLPNLWSRFKCTNYNWYHRYLIMSLVLFLVVVISLFLLFFYVVFKSTYRCINPIFLLIYLKHMSSLGCKALCIVIC